MDVMFCLIFLMTGVLMMVIINGFGSKQSPNQVLMTWPKNKTFQAWGLNHFNQFFMKKENEA